MSKTNQTLKEILYDFGDITSGVDINQALKEIQELLVDDMQGKKKILPSEHGDNPLKNSSEDYCMGYNQAIDDYENNIKARLQ